MFSPHLAAEMVLIGGLLWGVTNRMDVFTIDEGKVSWMLQGQDAPYMFCWSGSASIGDIIYLAGGWAYLWTDGSWSYTKASMYNLATNTWTILNDLNTPRRYTPAMFIMRNRLYAAGGDPGLAR